jgi:large subunit ribosomal protein L33
MRDIVYLVSTANTGFFYTTTKNPKLQKGKIEVKKYDPVVKKHVVFKESKKPTAKKK